MVPAPDPKEFVPPDPMSPVPVTDTSSPDLKVTAVAETTPPIDWEDMRSWNSVGWYVALLFGIWGALMGIGEYSLADAFFGTAVLLFCVKWGHATHIHRTQRRIGAFALGLIVPVALTAVAFFWTSKKAKEAERQNGLLSQLKQLPALKSQVDQIPALKIQIDSLTAQNGDATSKINIKQDTIEKLSRALASQLGKTETNLSANINQYRTDVGTAVSRLIQPDRHLTDTQRNEIYRAYLSSFCSLPTKEQTNHIGGVSIVWEPNGEAAEYAGEFVETLDTKPGCGFFGYRSELRAAGRQIVGLTLIAKDWDHPSIIASAIRGSFIKTQVPFGVESGTLGIAGQADITIVVGSK